ncbi:hypothetical protein Tco_1524638 [Tanacetum coccineum]
MRTRSQARKHRQQQARQTSVESPNLEKPNNNPPIVTMDDNRTMAQLLEAPTEGYEDAIVVPKITANNFEIKHERPSTSVKAVCFSHFPWRVKQPGFGLKKRPLNSILSWDDLALGPIQDLLEGDARSWRISALLLSLPSEEVDFLMEEIDAFLEHDDSIPPGVDGIYDSEGDTVYLEELLSVGLRVAMFASITEYSMIATGKGPFPFTIYGSECLNELGPEMSTLAFWTGLYGYFQIPIDPLDKGKGIPSPALRDMCLSSHAFWVMLCIREKQRRGDMKTGGERGGEDKSEGRGRDKERKRDTRRGGGPEREEDGREVEERRRRRERSGREYTEEKLLRDGSREKREGHDFYGAVSRLKEGTNYILVVSRITYQYGCDAKLYPTNDAELSCKFLKISAPRIWCPGQSKIARIVKTLVLSVLTFIHKSFTSSASFWESRTDIQEKDKKKAKNKQNRARSGKDQVKSKSKVIHMKKIQLEGLKLPKPQVVLQ